MARLLTVAGVVALVLAGLPATAHADDRRVAELEAKVKQLQNVIETLTKDQAKRTDLAAKEAQAALAVERARTQALQVDLALTQRRSLRLEQRIRDLEGGKAGGEKAKPDPVEKALEEFRAKYTALVRELEARQKAHAEDLAAHQREAEKLRDQHALVLKTLTAELTRLQAERAALTAQVAQRDQKLLQATQEAERARAQAVAAEDQSRAALARMENLLKQIKELQLPPPGNRPPAGLLNPPAAFVKGKVEKVDPKDPTLVVISLGTDSGVQVGHTLEVYRLQPKPEYLGRARVIQANARSSVARAVAARTAKDPVIRVGDEVASRLER
jgi:hypothetical protein